MTRILALLALVIAILSLALNVMLIARLDQARTGAVALLDRTSQRLDALPDVSVRQTFHLSQSFPVAGVIPFNQDLVVPISTTVPINTTTNVKTDTMFGTFDVPVTINTSVPINLQVPLTVSQTVPYSLTVPLDMDVPIEIRLRDLGADAAINEAHQEIQRLRETLQ